MFESQLVSRWGLRASLARALPPEMMNWNKRVARYEEKSNEVCVYFEDGTQATADLLVGAGVIHSTSIYCLILAIRSICTVNR